MAVIQSTQRLPRNARVRMDAGTGELHARRYRLRVLSGPDQGLQHTLESSAVLGTDASADIRLTDPTVSRLHLSLSPEEEGVRVRDMQSSNGTFLGGALVVEAVALEGTELTVGASVLQLGVEDSVLEPPLETSSAFANLVAESMAMRQVVRLLQRVAQLDSTTLIHGETGVGKDELARALHGASLRRGGPFVVLDCAAVAPELLDSELFGHGKGAFTGAANAREGVFVRAHRGTLFLDAVSELPLEAQAKLLRALETKRVRPLGEDEDRPSDVRVVAATRRWLPAEVQAGRFRADLYYRLAVVLVQVPPLRERPEDLEPLVRHFLRKLGHPDTEVTPKVMARLRQQRWPGNVRELLGAVERWLAGQDAVPSRSAEHPVVDGLQALPFKDAKEVVVERFTRQYLTALMEKHGGNVSRAAAESGLARTYLHHLLGKLGLGTSGGPAGPE